MDWRRFEDATPEVGRMVYVLGDSDFQENEAYRFALDSEGDRSLRCAVGSRVTGKFQPGNDFKRHVYGHAQWRYADDPATTKPVAEPPMGWFHLDGTDDDVTPTAGGWLYASHDVDSRGEVSGSTTTYVPDPGWTFPPYRRACGMDGDQ